MCNFFFVEGCFSYNIQPICLDSLIIVYNKI